MALTPIVELGVSEAYAILTGRFGVTDLPPLESIENEDWGRDYLLSLASLQAPRRGLLAEAGLSVRPDGALVGGAAPAGARWKVVFDAAGCSVRAGRSDPRVTSH